MAPRFEDRTPGQGGPPLLHPGAVSQDRMRPPHTFRAPGPGAAFGPRCPGPLTEPRTLPACPPGSSRPLEGAQTAAGHRGRARGSPTPTGQVRPVSGAGKGVQGGAEGELIKQRQNESPRRLWCQRSRDVSVQGQSARSYAED